MAPRFKPPEGPDDPDDEDDDEEEDEGGNEEGMGDPMTQLLAGLLLVMCCKKCKGEGVMGKATCICRKFGYKLATEILEEEGLIEKEEKKK